MNINSCKLYLSKELEKKIDNVCNFNGAKYKLVEGKVIDIDKSNISFIEPHRVFISYKKVLLILLCYNSNNIFLYNSRNPITPYELGNLFKDIREQLK